MMRVFALIILCCLGFTLAGFAQTAPAAATRSCATVAYGKALQAQNPQYEQEVEQAQQAVQQQLSRQGQWQNLRAETVITIPVVFHVVYNEAEENISEEQILSQLAVLNSDFRRLNTDAVNTPAYFQDFAADTRIEFCLATIDPSGNPTNGITRTKTSKQEFDYIFDYIKKSGQGGINAWDRDQYLNIWTGNIKDGVLGYAPLPGGVPAAQDGVVLYYATVGAAPANPFNWDFNMGRTATHEVGHWLGLGHIWGADETSCSDDDGISDTPSQEVQTFGCPDGIQDSCDNGPNGNMYQNYMDYSNDACMNLFTKGQAVYMEAVLNTTRGSLLNSLACIGTIRSDFGTKLKGDTLLVAGKKINFADASQGTRPTEWYWEFEGGIPATSTEQNPAVAYPQPGLYDVKLTVSNGRLISTEEKQDFVKVTVSDLTVYPNPTSDYLDIEQPARIMVRHVELMNSVGKVVVDADVRERVLRLDVRHLQSGVYFLRLTSTNGTEIRKVNIIR